LRRVWICGIFLAGILAVASAAADLPGSCISWSLDRPLAWSDFRAAPPANVLQTSWVASPKLIINWSASFQAKRSGSVWTAAVVALTVTNCVDPFQSWAVPSRTSPETLHHEQLHFNLHEVYRRLLESTLRPMTVQTSTGEAACQSLNTQLNSTSQAILTRAQAAQTAFDADTAHGTNLVAQAAWESRIADLLVYPTLAP